jgi:hypothetical protein
MDAWERKHADGHKGWDEQILAGDTAVCTVCMYVWQQQLIGAEIKEELHI